MSRLDFLTIAIVAICIAALIYLVYRYVNLPHSTANSPTTEVVEADNTQSQTDDTAGFPAEDKENEDAKPGPGAVVEPEVIPEEKKPAQSTPSKPIQAIDNSANEAGSAAQSAGSYMVIAGSFEQTSHAKKQLRKIQSAGYPNARVEKFNKGAYASILVERFGSASDAKALVNTLKSKGFDAMVLVKR